MNTNAQKIEVPEISRSESESSGLGLDIVNFISSGDQYLTFCLGRELYGLNILNVTEIRCWEVPTRIPNAPVHIKGVVNIRGIVIPIIDLRVLFRVGDPQYLPTTVVIVLAVKSGKMDRTMGFVVDAVSDVLDVEKDRIKKSSNLIGSVSERYIHGLVNVGSDVLTLLDIEPLVALDMD